MGMVDFAKVRRMMVDGQVRTFDVTDHALLLALEAVPRERFVPPRLRPLAYADADLLLKEGGPGREPRRLMPTAPFARMVQLAEIGAEDVVLDVGCGTGYSAAVLARLAGSVVALEEDGDLARTAAETLMDFGADNVAVVTGRLRDGYPAEGPYDAILIEGAVEVIPEPMFEQLKDGGRLVAVVGRGLSGAAMIYQRTGGDVAGREAFNASVPPLPGFSRPHAFAF